MNIELRGISKQFGAIRANDDIHLTIASGSIHGILGENGAGKSTLMKILAGLVRPDCGCLILDNQRVALRSAQDAIRLGIAMLHQDPLDFPAMPVLDNCLVGMPGALFPDKRGTVKILRALADQLQFGFAPEAILGTLTLNERQQIELLRVLHTGMHVLIFDEPTACLSLPQKERLFKVLRRLAAEGKTILFISHKLEEAQQLCDRITVLRHGRVAGEAQPPYDTRRLLKLMFGQTMTAAAPRGESRRQSVALVLRHAVVAPPGAINPRTFGEVNIEVRAGEIIGLAGMDGNGQSVFLRQCSGLARIPAGRLLLNGEDITGSSYRERAARGLAFMPAARLEEGLVPGLSILEHSALVDVSQGILVDWKQERRAARERLAIFHIDGSPDSAVETLSGGHQQRLLLALLRQPSAVILLEQALRGLDVESSVYLWNKLHDCCSGGAAVLFSSSDLNELIQHSHRILVFCGHTIRGPFEAEQVSVEHLGSLIGAALEAAAR